MCPPLVAAAIITAVGAAAAGGIAAGSSAAQNKKGRKAQAEANKIGYDTWSQEFEETKKVNAFNMDLSKRKELVSNLNNVLGTDTALHDRLLNVWGGRK
jgi:hypothetical protein